ncbi:putative C-S lyase [candidate division KSB3 bacterium]|uniref:cysteine-S-conjugate beta-lyase n=1 Tax=candidate division KSB3 bacterium TaxID=2044937 RepID=A0A9D5Q7A9_9BACT|nr:putative C-S lyase [candidate division KSB3 bacterium]MBD3325681.1 putative C-S lyase [candidate division KSB3 bacterium]
MHYDFDTVIDRRNTNCYKWDLAEKMVGTQDVLPLWVADMDFQSPPAVIDALKNRVEHGIFGYTAIPDSCYEAVINWMHTRHGWKIEKDWIVFTPGVVSAFHWAVKAYTHPGDNVVVQPPVYFPFFKAVNFNGCHLNENQLRYENGTYRIDFDDLEQRLESRTKLLLFCTPHNPVGRVWTREELTRLAELCLERNIILCSDEIHSDIIFRDACHIPTATLSQDIAQNTVTCSAANKTFNIAGLKTGFMIIPNPRLREEFLHAQQSTGVSSSSLFGGIATDAAYTHGEPWLQQLLQYLEDNLTFLEQFLSERIPQIKLVRPEGTYIAWLDCQALGLDDDGLKNFMLHEANVWLNDGPTFGNGGSGFQRLNFGCPRSILAEALQRIETAVNRLAS